MNTVASHGARSWIQTASSVTKRGSPHAVSSRVVATRSTQFWICRDCALSTRARSLQRGRHWRRQFSLTARRLDDDGKPETSPKASTSTSTKPDGPSKPRSEASLPSTKDERRWQTSRRMEKLMDTVLARASVAGQHINIYTGTDYSGIEALRSEISDQEKKVRNYHRTIDTARSTHHEAHAKQASAQKEIVSLLERKSSWSPADLERYMSLVRSEHTMEQDVQSAKENLTVVERDLENARSLLERLERKQYHEEQIWSDTIRRNSTWVTFGLMGVNIILLLAQIAIFEPYRRRKIVKEVNRALDEKAGAAGGAAATAQVEREIDEVVPPAGVAIEYLEPEVAPTIAAETLTTSGLKAGERPLSTTEAVPVEAIPVAEPPKPTAGQSAHPQSWSEKWDTYKDSLQDLFSERIIQMKKVDVTTTALQGAATGVAAMGLLFVIWRPR